MKRVGLALAWILAAQATLLLLGCNQAFTTMLTGKKVTNNQIQPAPEATPWVATEVALPSCDAPQKKKGLGLTKSLTDEFQGTGKQLGKDLGSIAPELRDAALKAIDEIDGTDERAVGQAASFLVIAQNGGLVLEQELVAYVNDVANLVAHFGSREGRDGKKPRVKARRFFVGVLDSPEVNAFSMPGGYLYLTKGLLQNLSSESELAWVLGHEIAHTDLEHGLKALKIQVGAGGAMDKVTGKNASFADQDFFANLVGRLAGFMVDRGFGRADESEADARGLEYAMKAGYDARGAERVLAMMSALPRARGRSHDSPYERLEDLCPKIKEGEKGNGNLAIKRFNDHPAIQRLTLADSGSPTL